jgi:hypothetical protein
LTADRRPLTIDHLSFAVLGRLDFLQHLEDEADRPFSRTAVQGQGNRRRLQDLLPARSQVSSTADMEFNSPVTLLSDADAQSNEFLVFPGQSTVSQGIGFKIFKFPKRADAAAKHRLIVFLAGLPYVADFIEHRTLPNRTEFW